MNVLNEFEMRFWLNTELNGVAIRAANINRTDTIRNWVNTRYRRWLLKQEGLFACVIDPDISPYACPINADRETRMAPIPIGSVMAHKSSKQLNYHYEINLDLFDPLKQGQVSIPVRMVKEWQWKLLAESVFYLWYPTFGPDKPELELSNVLDWMCNPDADLPRDIKRLSVEDAVAKSLVWHSRFHDEDIRQFYNGSDYQTIDAHDPGERVVIPTLRGTVHELLDEQSLLYEHIHMRHCVDSYWPSVASGHARLFHLELTVNDKVHKATLELQHETNIRYDQPMHDMMLANLPTRMYRKPENNQPLWTIIQCRGIFNVNPISDILDLANQVLAYVNANLQSVNKENNNTNEVTS